MLIVFPFRSLTWLADVLEELLSNQATQLAIFALMLCLVSFVAGTVLWFLGGLGAVGSWQDVPMDEAIWEAWCASP